MMINENIQNFKAEIYGFSIYLIIVFNYKNPIYNAYYIIRSNRLSPVKMILTFPIFPPLFAKPGRPAT